jgi:hypothetical protein
MKTFVKSRNTSSVKTGRGGAINGRSGAAPLLFFYIFLPAAIAEPTVMHFSDSKTMAVGKYVYDNSNTMPNIKLKKPAVQAPAMPDPMSLLKTNGQAASTPILLQPQARVGEIKNPKGPEKESGKKTQSTAASRKLTPKERANMPLVPPPPPVTPSFLVSPFSEMPFSVELLSKDDLNQKLKEIQLNLDDARKGLKEKQDDLADTKDKAVRFADLEAAQKDAEDADKEIERGKLKVSGLESQQKSVEKRLSELAKRTSGTGSASKRKKK